MSRQKLQKEALKLPLSDRALLSSVLGAIAISNL